MPVGPLAFVGASALQVVSVIAVVATPRPAEAFSTTAHVIESRLCSAGDRNDLVLAVYFAIGQWRWAGTLAARLRFSGDVCCVLFGVVAGWCGICWGGK
jgi:hypothetical protein